MCFLIYLSILCYLNLLLLSLHSICWCSTAPKYFNETRSPIFACIQGIRSDVSLFNWICKLLTIASFLLSIYIFVLDHVFFGDLKRLSTLSSCIVGHAAHFLFFMLLAFHSKLVWFFRLLYCLSFSVLLSCNFFLRSQYCFFNRLWSLNVWSVEFVGSCTDNVNWGSSGWF